MTVPGNGRGVPGDGPPTASRVPVTRPDPESVDVNEDAVHPANADEANAMRTMRPIHNLPWPRIIIVKSYHSLPDFPDRDDRKCCWTCCQYSKRQSEIVQVGPVTFPIFARACVNRL